jgi:hypothetical protein
MKYSCCKRVWRTPLRELWVVGSCWTVAIVAYVFGVSQELILPLVALGIVTGLAKC